MILERIKSLLAPKVSTDAKLAGISLFLGKTLDNFDQRVKTAESQQLLHGKDGLDGKDGKDGRNGKDGRDGADGKDGNSGAKGSKGDTGPVGKTGARGVSVVDAEIAADDHLVLKLSDGGIIDAGELPVNKGGSDVFVAGNAWQITVSSTAPDNPQINQLWYDIS